MINVTFIYVSTVLKSYFHSVSALFHYPCKTGQKLSPRIGLEIQILKRHHGRYYSELQTQRMNPRILPESRQALNRTGNIIYFILFK